MDKAAVKALRARAHHLKPVVIVGQASLSDAVLDEIELALNHHELIKIRVNAGDRDERRETIAAICEKTGAELIQTIGHVVSVYREAPKD